MSNKRDVLAVQLKTPEDLELRAWIDLEATRIKNQGDRSFSMSQLALDLLRRGREDYIAQQGRASRRQSEPGTKRTVRKPT